MEMGFVTFYVHCMGVHIIFSSTEWLSRRASAAWSAIAWGLRVGAVPYRHVGMGDGGKAAALVRWRK